MRPPARRKYAKVYRLTVDPTIDLSVKPALLNFRGGNGCPNVRIADHTAIGGSRQTLVFDFKSYIA
jgi:hypothetical protein